VLFKAFKRMFDEKSYSEMVDELNTGLSKITISGNMDVSIREYTDIPANAEFIIEHGLKTVPKYRMILRQIDGGYITDTDTKWTESTVSLYNNGAIIKKVIIAFMRE